MKVCKFGGSSVADSSQIKKVKAILDSDRDRSVVVVSAPGKRFSGDEKVTDMLLECAALVSKGGTCDEKFSSVKERYRDIAEGLGLERSVIDKELDEVMANINKGLGKDYAASRGEHLNAKLISKFFGWNYVETGECIVIGENNTILDESYSNLSSIMKEGEKYVVPGFYGRSPEGDVRCFSRGGSDITGAIVASALDADVYENWTDVSGVFSSDPRYVKSAHVVPALSYKMVRELGEVGASVFHEEAIAPVVEKAIPINIRNTNAPEDDGTIIGRDPEESGVVGVSAKGGLSRIYVRKLMLMKDKSIESRILALLESYGIKPCYTIHGCDAISWFFDSKTLEGRSDEEMDAFGEKLYDEFDLDDLVLDEGLAMVGLVGKDLDETMEYVEALDEVKKMGIAPLSLSFDGYTTFLFAIPDDVRNEVLNAISERIFEGK